MGDIIDLYNEYIVTTPSFVKVLEKYESDIIGIDHIAFRSLEGPFILDKKYELQEGKYYFENLNVEAVWFKNHNKDDKYNFNRIFSSYYLGTVTDEKLSHKSKELVNNFIYKKELNIDYKTFKNLYEENQYIAWTLIHGSKINHVALQVRDIYELTSKLIKDGFQMNINDNEIYNISNDKKLIQTSIMSDKNEYRFEDGTYKIPGSFVEFVERSQEKEGFETKNAKKIFNSTLLK